MARPKASAAAVAAGGSRFSSCWQSISSSSGGSSSRGHAARATCPSLGLLVLAFFLSLAFIEPLLNGSLRPTPNRLWLRPPNASQRAHAIKQRNSLEHGLEEGRRLRAWGLR